MGLAAKLGEAIRHHAVSYAKGLGSTILDRIDPKTIASEMASTFTDRIVPHGAAELAHALMTQNSGYVPYGQESIPMADADATPPATGDTPQAPPSMAEQYQASLAMYGQAARHNAPDQAQTPDL